MYPRILALLVLAAVTSAFPARAGTPIAGFDETVFQGSLSSPTAIAFLPGGRMLVTEKAGALKLTDGVTSTTVTTIDVCSGSEMGLLGIAVDPSYATNGFVYLYRTKQTANCGSSTGRFNEVVRITIGAGDTFVPGSLVVFTTGAQTDNGNHDGGCLRIGPDAKLYVGVGDTGLGDNQGGPGSSTNPYSQNLNVLMGKVLRLNLDGTIPADNPFVGQVGKRGEIFASGFRNPFRFGFDPLTGRLWLADVGDLTVEEIDIVTSGGNYAWPHCEGTLPASCELPGDIDPIFTYPHSGGTSLGSCIIGGGFAGAGFGGLDDDYFFGDCTSSRIYHATPNATRDGIATPTLFVDGAGIPSDVVFGPDGALYYVAEGAGEVRRVAPIAVGGDQPVAGRKLTLRDNVDPARKRLSMQAKDVIVLGGPGDDPTAVGTTSTLRVMSAGFDDTYPLPAANWKVIGDPADHKGFKYADKLLAAGPIKSAQVKAGKLVKASGKGAALGHTLATNPDPVTTVLAIGAQRYCATFGGTVKFTASKSFAAKLAPAPAACP
jgi:glucose/arabinose dehydrogenase